MLSSVPSEDFEVLKKEDDALSSIIREDSRREGWTRWRSKRPQRDFHSWMDIRDSCKMQAMAIKTATTANEDLALGT